MAYGVVTSNGHVTDDVTWPPNVLWGSTVGYPGDSLASCYTVDRRSSDKQVVQVFEYTHRLNDKLII